MGMQGAGTDSQSTLPSWWPGAGAAGGNPGESSCPEEGSSRSQKKKQRTGQPNTRGRDRDDVAVMLGSRGKWGAIQTIRSPRGHHQEDSTQQAQFSPPRGQRGELVPREFGLVVERAQGISALSLTSSAVTNSISFAVALIDVSV